MPSAARLRHRPVTTARGTGRAAQKSKRPLRYRIPTAGEWFRSLGVTVSSAAGWRRWVRDLHAALWERIAWVVGLVTVTVGLWWALATFLVSVVH